MPDCSKIVPNLDSRRTVPTINDLVILEGELENAKSTPRTIVDGYIYADLSMLVAAGGTGKTTVVLYEMIHIAIGRPLWGKKIVNSGTCILITAEDSREMCLSRVNNIAEALSLTDIELALVRKHVLIWDVSALPMKLVRTEKDIVLTDLPHKIVTAFKGQNIAMITFDPLVSFGASENAVNDNAHALVAAARVMFRGINCCIRFIHHTGQEVARNKIMDQYAGRGGTALPDGSRMVNVLMDADASDRKKVPDLKPDDTALLYAMPKFSYGQKPPVMFIIRNGWRFDYAFEKPPIPEADQLAANKEQLIRFLNLKVEGKIYLTKANIENDYLRELSMKRGDCRQALGQLIAEGRVYDENMPEDRRQGSRKTYLKPTPPESKHVSAG